MVFLPPSKSIVHVETESPSAETRPLNVDDVALRAGGFRIVSRPADGPAVWQRPARPPVSEHVAAAIVKRERKCAEPAGAPT